MSAKPRLTLLGLFSLFTLLGLVALPGRATAAATLIVSSPGSITTDSRLTITVNLTGSTTGDTITLSLQGGSGTLTSTGNGGNNTANTTGNGAYTFATAHVNKPGAAYTLTAKVTAGPDLNAFGTSAPFAVTAGAAANVVFTTQPSNAASGAAIAPPVVVHVVDADVNSVPGVPVTLALTAGAGRLSGAATQLTDGTGTATFADLSVDRAGAGKQLTATSGSAPPTASNAFAITAGTPTVLSFTQQPGNAASGAAITPPVVVHVADAANNPVPGVSVVLTKKSGPGTVGGTLSQATDASGNATFGSLSANLVGTYQLTATDAADSLAADSSAFMVTSGTAAALSFTQQPTAGAVFASGAAIAPIYKVLATDASGNPVPGAAVTLALTAGAGRLSGAATQLTDGTGTATFAGLSVDRAGAGKQLTATSGSAPPTVSNAFAITAGTPTAISFTQQPSNASPNAIITPSVKVQILDVAGNPVPAVSVAMALSGGAGTLSGTRPQTTDATGVATFADLKVNAAGTYQLTATDTADSLTVASSIFTITTGAVTQISFTTQPTGTTAGAIITPPVVVHVADAANNPVPGVSVALDKKSGSGTVGGTLSQATDASGNATFGNLSANLADTYQLTATGGGLPPVDSGTFVITAGAAANIAFMVQPSGTASGATIAPPVVVKVTDTFGNVVAGAGVSLVLAPGSTGNLSGGAAQPTDGSGSASFNALKINLAGVKQLTATSGSLIVNSTTFAITAGTPTVLSFTTQPSNTASGAVITPPVVVHVADAANNPVPGVSVVLTKKSGPGTVGGTLSQATDASGNATFGSLSANLVGTYQLTATDAADSLAADSSAFAVTTGTATQIAFTTQPANTTSGVPLTPPVVVQLLDAAGNPLPNVPVTLTLSGGPGTLSGTITQITDANGNATFNDLNVDKVGATYTLTATSTGLTKASTRFAITAAAAAAITFTTQPSNTTAGKTITPPVVVTVTDPVGNPVPGTSVSLTLSTGNSPGGTAIQVSDARGRATFSDLSITQIGTYEIIAASGTLTPITSNAFTITAGTANTLTFTKQPSNIVSGANIAPPVVATLTDAKGNPVSGILVTVTLNGTPAAGGAATLAGTISQTTDASGNATFGSLNVDKVGTIYTLTATGAGLTSQPSSSFAVTKGAAKTLTFTAQPSNTASGAAITLPVVVQVLDAANNPVSGVPVTVTLNGTPTTGGTATLAGTISQTTDASGNATFNDLSVNKAGTTYVLKVASGNATPVNSSTFAITPGAGLLTFTTPPSNAASGTPLAPAVVVQFLDGSSNPIAGASVSLALPTGSTAKLSGTITQTTDTSGNATFSNLSVDLVGSYQLTATSGSLTSPPSSSFTITTGPAAHIRFTQQPTTGDVFGFGTSLSTTVRLLDAANNPVGGSTIMLSLAVGAGPLNGQASQPTDVTGTATFSGLSITSSGNVQLKAEAANGTLSVLSNVFTIGNPIAAITVLSTNVGLVHAGNLPFVLTIAGNGFAPGTVVTFNNQPSDAPTNPQVTNVTVNSGGTQVTASIAASLVTTTGTYAVIVTNPGTRVSNAAPFLVLPLGPSVDASGTIPHGADSNMNTQYFDDGLQFFSVPFDYTYTQDRTGAKKLAVNEVLRVFRLTDSASTDHALPPPSFADLTDTGAMRRLAVWNPDASAYALTILGSTTGLADQLVLGRGYWGHFQFRPLIPGLETGLIPGLETGLKTRGLEAKEIANGLNTQRQFSITLQTGWNMIGDPFTGSVKLSDLQVQDGGGNAFSLVDANNQALVSSTLYRYSLANGSMGYVALLPTKGDILAPYVGYWVLAYQPCTLLIPSP